MKKCAFIMSAFAAVLLISASTGCGRGYYQPEGYTGSYEGNQPRYYRGDYDQYEPYEYTQEYIDSPRGTARPYNESYRNSDRYPHSGNYNQGGNVDSQPYSQPYYEAGQQGSVNGQENVNNASFNHTPAQSTK